MARHPLLSTGPAGPEEAEQEEHLLLQWNASAVGLHHTTFACLRIFVVSECVQTRDVPPTSQSLACLQGGAGKEGPAAPALLAAHVVAWLEGHATAAGSGASAVGMHHTPSHATFAHLRVSLCMWSQNVLQLEMSLLLRRRRRLWLRAGLRRLGKDVLELPHQP